MIQDIEGAARIVDQGGESSCIGRRTSIIDLCDFGLERAVALAGKVLLEQRESLDLRGREWIVSRLVIAGLSARRPNLASRVRDGSLDFAANLVRQCRSARCNWPTDAELLLIFFGGSSSAMILAPSGLDIRRRHDEGVAVAGVEPDGDVPRELDMLALVLPDRHQVGVIEQDVGCLKHRIGEERRRDRLLLRRRTCP